MIIETKCIRKNDHSGTRLGNGIVWVKILEWIEAFTSASLALSQAWVTAISWAICRKKEREKVKGRIAYIDFVTSEVEVQSVW